MAKAPSVAEFLTRHINGISMTQLEISIRLGYSRANIIAMWKSGASRIPFAKIEPLCALIDANPRELMDLALREYHSELHDFIVRNVGTISAP